MSEKQLTLEAQEAEMEGKLFALRTNLLKPIGPVIWWKGLVLETAGKRRTVEHEGQRYKVNARMDTSEGVSEPIIRFTVKARGRRLFREPAIELLVGNNSVSHLEAPKEGSLFKQRVPGLKDVDLGLLDAAVASFDAQNTNSDPDSMQG